MQHDKETVAAIRAAFDDICRSLPTEQQAVRSYVAARILKSASEGELTFGGLRQAGNIALLELYAGVARI
ncbi:hypothetical protein V1291_000264 [Nitrobacteraceae bacterium AZCC 1564]